MNNLTLPEPYPLKAFPLSIRQPVQEVLQLTQAPDALVAMSFLMTMSASAQGLYDVRLPTDQLRPVSVNLLVIAPSGERKTGVDSMVSAPIQEFDAARIRKHEADMKQYKAKMGVWKTTYNRLVRRISELAVDGEPTDDFDNRLAAHAGNEPARPRLRYLLRQNATARALMDAVEGEGESIAFISDEGEVIIKGGIMRQAGVLNKMWDGASTLSLDRSEGVNVIAREPRLTVAYMVQPAVFQELLERRGENLRGSGHWARFLVGWPTSRQGTRQVHMLFTHKFHLPAFHKRVSELLEEFGRQIDEGKRERQTIVFSEDAKEKWVACSNGLESLIYPGIGELHSISDFVSKAMEITGRVAALLHVFSGQEGEISMETLDRAIQIVEWHLLEFKRIFTPHPTIPQEQVDAITLESYLYRAYWSNNIHVMPKNAVLRNGPIRPKMQFDVALSLLIQSQKVSVWPVGKTNYIYLNQAYFGAIPVVPLNLTPITPLLGSAGNY